MSDPINPEPQVLDVSQLPTRASNDSKKSLVENGLFEDDILSYSLFQGAPLDDLAISEASLSDSDEDQSEEPIDAQEIYDLISTISDPEHPLTLGQLAVVNLEHIQVIDSGDPDKMSEIIVEITPTITHCSLATLIGLGIRVRLDRCLPPRYRITINVRKGTHQSETQVNKQLNDKERVAAACENDQLLQVISNMLATCI